MSAEELQNQIANVAETVVEQGRRTLSPTEQEYVRAYAHQVINDWMMMEFGE